MSKLRHTQGFLYMHESTERVNEDMVNFDYRKRFVCHNQYYFGNFGERVCWLFARRFVRHQMYCRREQRWLDCSFHLFNERSRERMRVVAKLQPVWEFGAWAGQVNENRTLRYRVVRES